MNNTQLTDEQKREYILSHCKDEYQDMSDEEYNEYKEYVEDMFNEDLHNEYMSYYVYDPEYTGPGFTHPSHITY